MFHPSAFTVQPVIQLPARKPFLLRIDPAILDAVQRWANDDLRSLNGQIEFLLRQALIDARRWKPPTEPTGGDDKPPTPPRE